MTLANLRSRKRRQLTSQIQKRTMGWCGVVGILVGGCLVAMYHRMARFKPPRKNRRRHHSRLNQQEQEPGIAGSLARFSFPIQNGNMDDTNDNDDDTGDDNGTYNNSCRSDYRRIASQFTPNGLTRDDWDRSVAYTGNRHRLAAVATKLAQRTESVTIVVNGGSISLGHGIAPSTARYSDQLQDFLNTHYSINVPQQQKNNNNNNKKQHHHVYNRGSHGADMCAMAKRLNFLNLPTPPDLFVLEFAVNDYQGQDHRVHIDHKTDVFFDGFVSIAACAETVVYRLLTDYPNAAVVFLEFQTAILNRKTAQLLHMGVAQHYQVPVLSYADVLWPDFYRLFDILKPNNYSVPATLEIDSVLPFPHGCAPCQADHISNQFRAFGCKSVCVFAKRSGYFAGEASICDTDGWHHRPCYVPFLAHDAVHPSVVGHQIARDLIVHFLAETAHRVCRGQTFAPHVLPTHSGWLVAGPQYPQKLRMRSDFVLVRDTMEIFAHQNPLLAHHHSAGFQLKDDALSRKGWISENPMGDETITFQFDLPREKCYAVFLTVLRSYETVGSFSVVVHDKFQNTSTPPRRIDCLWEPHISVPIDMQITPDHRAQCTGQCAVTVTTLPEIADGRQGNLIKIMSLSVRKCITKPL